jgi:hypothetical protein
MRKAPVVVLSLVLAVAAAPLLAQDDDEWYEPLSPDQLDNLLAPIALYPDPLLAQVLVAATFPDQIDEADRFVRFDSDPDDLDQQPWDVSVKAVAHYPEVLAMMADDLDWTTTLGQAYVYQSTDVMSSVQRLRAQAQQAGNLVPTPEMQVVVSGGYIQLWPAQPQYIFVPRYDPAVVFFVRAPLFFGVRFGIGAWLNCAFDWHEHRVYYHGWEHGPEWVTRSRPYIHPTNVYVNVHYNTVIVNREVTRREVNYRGLDRYDSVHRSTSFDNVKRREPGVRAVPRPASPPSPTPVRIENKVIRRNVDVGDPRLKEFRGHVPRPPTVTRTPDAPAFIPGQGVFNPHQESSRGRSSRETVKAAPPKTSPKPSARRVERKPR